MVNMKENTDRLRTDKCIYPNDNVLIIENSTSKSGSSASCYTHLFLHRTPHCFGFVYLHTNLSSTSSIMCPITLFGDRFSTMENHHKFIWFRFIHIDSTTHSPSHIIQHTHYTHKSIKYIGCKDFVVAQDLGLKSASTLLFTRFILFYYWIFTPLISHLHTWI